MKAKKIIASMAIISMMLTSVSAMYDENAKKGNTGDDTKQVKVMSITTTSVENGSGEQVGSGNMAGSGINNASGTGVMKSEKGQARAAEAKMKKEEAKEKVGQHADKAERAMNKFQEKFERKTKQEKLNQFQALGAKIDRTIEKFVNSDISEEKKEAYRNLFEYIRALNEEKIAILETESEEVETSTGTEAE